MPATDIATIECPNCKNRLPAWSQTCQFCGNPLKGVVRPVNAIVDTWTDKPTWQEVGYIVCSVIFILMGGLEILQGFAVVPVGSQHVTPGHAAYLQIMGGLAVILGAGMLFQQLWAQFLVKWYSVLALVISIGGFFLNLMMYSVMAKILGTGAALLILLENAGFITLYAFTLYFIKVVGDVDP